MKPVYVPPKSRTTKEKGFGSHRTSRTVDSTRFHGAFTGGFSAGFYNTVGSKEGWEPTSVQHTVEEQEEEDSLGQQDHRTKKRRIQFKPQRIEDFMDDQDKNEWGGPTKIHSHFDTVVDNDDAAADKSSQQNKKEESLSSKIFNLFYTSESMETIGKKLLRKLGWRENQNFAYVPDNLEGERLLESDDHNQLESDFLKNRGLRKMNMNASQTIPPLIIPETKIDHFGIGFSPFNHAPEFELYKQRKQRTTENDYANSQGPSNLDRRTNIYRTNDLLIGEDSTMDGYELVRRKGLLSTLSAPDLSSSKIGGHTRLHGGSTNLTSFTLEDDEDHVYDLVASAKGSSIKSFGDEYHHEVYDDSDSNDDQDLPSIHQQQTKEGDHSTAFADALNSWASIPVNSTNTAKDKDSTLLKNKAPLPNFVPGQVNDASISVSKRWNGPYIPPVYILTRHKFQTTEPLAELKKLSEAMKLELKERRKHYSQQQSLAKLSPAPTIKNSTDPKMPMAGNTFLAIKEEMNKRFAPSGTHVMDPSTTAVSKPSTDMDSKQQAKVTRTTLSWIPQALLCKRFHITSLCPTEQRTSSVSTNETKKLERAKVVINSQHLSDTRQSGKSTMRIDPDYNNVADEILNRPSACLLQSIFDSDGESEPLNEEKKIRETINRATLSKGPLRHDVLQKRAYPDNATHDTSSSSEYDEGIDKVDLSHRHEKERKKENKHRKHGSERKEKRNDYI